MKKSQEQARSTSKETKPAEVHHHQPVRRSNKKLIITIAIVVLLAVGLLWLLVGKGDKMDSPIVAKVNGEPIYQKDVDMIMTQAKQQEFPLTEEQITEQLITKKVLLQEAKKQKLNIDDAAIDKYITDLEGLLGQPIDPLLERMNVTEKEFREQVREQLTITKLLEDKTVPKESITDEQIEAFYEANKEAFTVPEQVNASHILVETEAEAKEIISQLEDGKDFGAVAKEKSIDPSAKTNNGNLGFFGKGQMVAEFEKAAYALNKGEISEPTKSQFGYHVIKVYEKRKAGKLSLAEAKEDIRSAIQEELSKQKVNAFVKELVSQAKIERPQQEKEE